MKSGKFREKRVKAPPPPGTTRGTLRAGKKGGELSRALRHHMKRLKGGLR